MTSHGSTGAGVAVGATRNTAGAPPRAQGGFTTTGDGAGSGMGPAHGTGHATVAGSSSRYGPVASHGSAGTHSSASIAISNPSDGIRSYATTIYLAVLDASDTRGDDGTLRALCSDLQ
jgi:hypothetical protein